MSEPLPYKAERQPIYTCGLCDRRLIVQVITKTGHVGAPHPCALGCGRILGVRGHHVYLLRAPHPYEINPRLARDA